MKSLFCSLFFLLSLTSLGYAAAPARSGHPYAEAICSSSAEVFFCEDFEGEDIDCLGFNNCGSTWTNPGIDQKDICFCGGGSYQFDTEALSPFSTSNRVWRVSKDTAFVDVVTGRNTGTGNGTIAGWLEPAIMGTGGQEWWGRFQVWFSADHLWPADYDFKTVFTLPRTFVDPPSAAYEAGIYFHQDFFCSGLGNFNDVPALRYSSSFAQFPYQNEYCPPRAPGLPANGINAPRFERERWYTIEYHVKLSSTSSGILDVWVDGNLAYHATRVTCAGGCGDMGYLMIMGWMNPADAQDGYYEIDNLILSRSYIGPPAVTVPVGPTTYWVATTGSESNTCLQARTEDTPKLTITSGASCLTPGDTLFVKAGTYAEQLTDEIPGGTSWSAPVTVRANTGETVTIAPGAGGDGAVYFTSAASQYIILDGINLDGTGETTGHGIIINGAANHIRVQNAEIKNFWNTGILVAGPTANDNEFINLKVHDNGTRPDQSSQNHGIWIETDNNLIEGCTVCNHTGHGIYVFSANAWQPNNNFIHRNLVYNNTTIGIGMYGASNTARNNIVYDSTNAGIKVSGTTANVTFNTIYSISEVGGYSEAGSGHTWRNNIFADSGDWGLWLATGVTGLTVQNNLFFNNTDGTIDNDASATITGTMTGDPLFVDATVGNLHVQTGSAAINAATSLPAITVDIDGDLRPNGVAQDIGADEMAGGVLPSAPSGLSGGLAGAGGGNYQ